MRRTITLALSITLCLLLVSCTGSSDKTEELALDIRAKYLGTESIDTTVTMTADSGGRSYEFKLKFTGTDTGGMVEVLEPESIKGLTARISDSGATLEFDGAVLDIGALFKDAMSPLEALPMLIGAWKNERITSHYSESGESGDMIVIETAVGSAATQKTWFGSEDMLPVYSELSVDGQNIITCRFEKVTL